MIYLLCPCPARALFSIELNSCGSNYFVLLSRNRGRRSLVVVGVVFETLSFSRNWWFRSISALIPRGIGGGGAGGYVVSRTLSTAGIFVHASILLSCDAVDTPTTENVVICSIGAPERAD